MKPAQRVYRAGLVKNQPVEYKDRRTVPEYGMHLLGDVEEVYLSGAMRTSRSAVS